MSLKRDVMAEVSFFPSDAASLERKREAMMGMNDLYFAGLSAVAALSLNL